MTVKCLKYPRNLRQYLCADIWAEISIQTQLLILSVLVFVLILLISQETPENWGKATDISQLLRLWVNFPERLNFSWENQQSESWGRPWSHTCTRSKSWVWLWVSHSDIPVLSWLYPHCSQCAPQSPQGVHSPSQQALLPLVFHLGTLLATPEAQAWAHHSASAEPPYQAAGTRSSLAVQGPCFLEEPWIPFEICRGSKLEEVCWAHPEHFSFFAKNVNCVGLLEFILTCSQLLWNSIPSLGIPFPLSSFFQNPSCKRFTKLWKT